MCAALLPPSVSLRRQVCRQGGGARHGARVAQGRGSRPLTCALTLQPRPLVCLCSMEELSKVLSKLLDEKLEGAVKKLDEKLEGAVKRLDALHKEVAAISRGTGANSQTLARMSFATIKLPGYWVGCRVVDGERRAGASLEQQRQQGMPCHPPDCALAAHHPCHNASCTDQRGCMRCRLLGLPACAGFFVLGPALIGCISCHCRPCHAARAPPPPRPPPCAADALLDLVSCAGWPADLAAVLDEVLAEHRGYRALLPLVLLKLAVRKGPEAGWGAGSGRDCQMPHCFRKSEQPPTPSACTGDEHCVTCPSCCRSRSPRSAASPPSLSMATVLCTGRMSCIAWRR